MDKNRTSALLENRERAVLRVHTTEMIFPQAKDSQGELSVGKRKVMKAQRR